MKNKLKIVNNYLLKTSLLIFLYAIGIVLALYFNDYYFDIMDAKANAYNIIFIILFPFLLLCVITKLLSTKICLKKDALLICLTTFFIFSLISTILSFNTRLAFLGVQGWRVGFFVIGSLIITILILKDSSSINFNFYIPVFIAIAAVFILAITDSFELDLLGFRYELYERSYHKYLTTIGNINWYVGYLSLIVPLFICLFVNEKNTKRTFVYGILSILGIINIAFIGADGIFLALGFVSFFIIPYIFYDIDRIKRFSFVLFFFAIAISFSRYLNYMMDGYSRYTRSFYVIIPCFLISIYLYFFSTTYTNKQYNKYKKTIIFVLESILLATAIIFTIISLKEADPEWGSDRILIWEYSLKHYINFDLKNKLFGLGPEMIYNIYVSMPFDFHGILQTSHSEPVQLLLSMGIFGLVSWLSCWICIFIYFFKEKAWRNSKLLPYYISLFAYFGQSIVNSSTVVNVCTLALIIVLYLIKRKEITSIINR